MTHAMTQIYPERYKSTYKVQDVSREELLHVNEKLAESCKDYRVQHVDDDFTKTSVKLQAQGEVRRKI